MEQLRSRQLDQAERGILYSMEREYSVMTAIVNAATIDYSRARFGSTWSLESSLFRSTADRILIPLFRIQVLSKPLLVL